MRFKLLIKKSIQLLKSYKFNFILKKINIFKYKRIYNKYYEMINSILSYEKYHSIIIFDSRVGWNIPLFQRPQHMAIELSKKGFLYFYTTTYWAA